MKKIISLFQRNYDGDRLVRDEVVPGAEWVLNGEGVATIKYDGTACMVKDGALYRRYDAKKGRTPPPDFIPAQDPDPVTGHHPGWVPVRADDPASKWYQAAWDAINGTLADGTYELCGPHFQSKKDAANPERLEADTFIPHGKHEIAGFPRDYEGIKAALAEMNIEGVVWHHPDGRAVKIKTHDFGLPWPRKEALS